jgi:hypothetical protein
MTAPIRALRRRGDRRYLGPTDYGGEPVNLAMADRWRRHIERLSAKMDRRTPRPLSAYLRGNPRVARRLFTLA